MTSFTSKALLWICFTLGRSGRWVALAFQVVATLLSLLGGLFARVGLLTGYLFFLLLVWLRGRPTAIDLLVEYTVNLRRSQGAPDPEDLARTFFPDRVRKDAPRKDSETPQ